MIDSTSALPGDLAWVAGSDAPEKAALNLGFMALTDSASLVVAATQGFGQPYGLTLNLQRQSSWAGLRDRLLSGALDAAQSLYGLVYDLQLGLGGGPATEMAVLMGLCQNGQAINLSDPLMRDGVTSAEALQSHGRQNGAQLTLAQTFPTGTHALWLNYWLAAHRPASAARRAQPGGSTGADGRAPQGRAHRRVLRRRPLGRPGRGPGHGLHPRHQPGDLARPPGKGPRHHPRLRRRLPQHRPRAGHGRPRCQPLHRTERRGQPGQRRPADQRPGLCRRPARRDRTAPARPLPGRPRQRLAGPASAALLQRRRRRTSPGSPTDCGS